MITARPFAPSTSLPTLPGSLNSLTRLTTGDDGLWNSRDLATVCDESVDERSNMGVDFNRDNSETDYSHPPTPSEVSSCLTGYFPLDSDYGSNSVPAVSVLDGYFLDFAVDANNSTQQADALQALISRRPSCSFAETMTFPALQGISETQVPSPLSVFPVYDGHHRPVFTASSDLEWAKLDFSGRVRTDRPQESAAARRGTTHVCQLC